MKFRKKFIPIIIAAAMLATSSTAFANQTTSNEITAINAEVKKQAFYGYVTGKVTNIGVFSEEKYITIESSDKQTYTLLSNNDTYVIDNKEIAVGDIVTGFYSNLAPKPLINPPRYTAVVIAKEDLTQSIKVDRFDSENLSSDLTLKINVTADTKIVDRNNTAYKGELTDKDLIIFYNISTRSYPAITTPTKIIVLEEQPIVNTEKFTSFEGKVTEIKDVEKDKHVLVENSDGSLIRFILNADTFYLDDFKIEMNSEIIGYYNTNQPTPFINPPQLKMDVVAKKSDKESIKLDRFDSSKTSSDGTLKLNVNEKTQIVLQNGEKFEGDYTDRKLLVVYGMTSKSIPALTSPTKIIVMYEKAVAPILTLPSIEELPKIEKNISVLENPQINALVVNNVRIDLTKPFFDAENNLMVPLREVTDALKLNITWDKATQSALVDGKYSVKIGEKKSGDVTLKVAPVLKDSKTFVSIEFFQKVMKLNNAYYFEGNVVIDTLNEKQN